MSLFLDEPDWVRPDQWPRLKGPTSLDFETVDPELKKRGASWAFANCGKVVGIGISGPAITAYYPVGHEFGNVDADKTWKWLKHELENPDPSLELIVFNWTYEMGWLKRYGIEPKCPVWDPGVAAALLDETRLSYSLNAISQTYLKEEKTSGDLMSVANALGVTEMWSNMDRMPAQYVGPYCEQDCALTLKLHTELQYQISQNNLERAYKLEHDILPVVLDMRWRGVPVNVPRVERRIEELKAREKEIHSQIKHIVGRDVEVWAADSIADACVLLGIDHPMTGAGKPSFQAGWLESHPHEFPQLVVEARRVNKLHSTFLQNYFLEMQENGRIHATFTPLRSDDGGAVTGRFTCADPNFQNLPAREGDSAAIVRGCVEPEEGDLWAAEDYGSQEPRLTVHFAAKAGCPGADQAVAEYHKNPRTDYHQFVANLTGLTRKEAKVVNLGLPYGMGGPKLCKESLGLPTRLAVFPRGESPVYFEHDQKEEAEIVARNCGRNVVEVAGEEGQAILDKYHERLPYLKSLMKMTTDVAASRGYIRTILGRRRTFLGDREKVTKYTRKKAFPYKALNCLIQGSGADMTKQAMVDLHREGHRILVTVHDELGLSVPSEAKAKEAAEIMRDAVPMLIPNVVDIEIGDSWAASMGLPVDD